jgi:hypothetical protein
VSDEAQALVAKEHLAQITRTIMPVPGA